MKTQPITEPEADLLASLLVRAIANGQLSIHGASPYATEDEWKRDGWQFNDRHDGAAVSSDAWRVEHGLADGAADGGPGERAEVSLYVQPSDLANLLAP